MGNAFFARIQLVNYIIAGKYTYWAQGINKGKSSETNLQFHLGWKKSIPWTQMILPQSKGKPRD